jgi:5'-methylthioadenosine phosphorylase
MFDSSRQVRVDTPYGSPSSELTIGEIGGRTVAFLARHGEGHVYNPGVVNYRANIYALKSLGVTHVISVSAVGSLREEMEPLHTVIPDQLFDRTRHRQNTFFDSGFTVHVGFAEPYCPELSRVLTESLEGLTTIHRGGTYVCMEGPQFSTRAESETYRKLGFDIIGMTALPEAKLAREAEMCYATMATVTDYDCWHTEIVSGDLIIERIIKNEEVVKEALSRIIPDVPLGDDCPCRHALDGAIVTPTIYVSDELLQKVNIFIGKYLE